MKKLTFISTILAVFFASILCGAISAQNTPSDTACDMEKAIKWFTANEWSHGMKVKVYENVNVCEFARQYHANENYWKKAFAYLTNTNLDSMAPGRYAIDGENVFASITEGPTKDFEATKWEAHQTYIDIQYIIRGEEKIGVGPVSTASVVEPYNPSKDIGFYNLPVSDSGFYIAKPGVFFIFFPQEAHRPGIKIQENTVKKIVIKVKVAKQ